MKGQPKTPKVNSLTLAKNGAQFYSKLEFDLHPLLNDKSFAEILEKINSSLSTLENVVCHPSKNKLVEISEEFQKTDKTLEKLKTKVNDMQVSLEKIEKNFQEKLVEKFEILKKTDPKDSDCAVNRKKVEETMKRIKDMIALAKTKLKEIQVPTEQALKRMHAIKPTLYALGIPENFDRCQKKAEKLVEELNDLCSAAAEMSLADIAKNGATVLKELTPITNFIPKLRSEIEKGGKLLEQADKHLRIFQNRNIAATVSVSEVTATSSANITPIPNTPSTPDVVTGTATIATPSTDNIKPLIFTSSNNSVSEIRNNAAEGNALNNSLASASSGKQGGGDDKKQESKENTKNEANRLT